METGGDEFLYKIADENVYGSDKTMAMFSMYGVELGLSSLWNPQALRIISPSEHTIHGQRYDVELQVTHLAGEDATEKERKLNDMAIISVLFDNKYYTREKSSPRVKKYIDTFFTSITSGTSLKDIQ